jgi:hypothetical protein
MNYLLHDFKRLPGKWLHLWDLRLYEDGCLLGLALCSLVCIGRLMMEAVRFSETSVNIYQTARFRNYKFLLPENNVELLSLPRYSLPFMEPEVDYRVHKSPPL